MSLPEYIVLFVLVVSMGIGLPALGDASLIAAGTLAGEGRLILAAVLATAMVAWTLGSLAGYEIGVRKGRWLLEHPGRLEEMRLKLLAKGDNAFAHNNFVAAVTMWLFVSEFSGCVSVYLFWERSSLASALSEHTWAFRTSLARRSRSALGMPVRRPCSVCL